MLLISRECTGCDWDDWRFTKQPFDTQLPGAGHSPQQAAGHHYPQRGHAKPGPSANQHHLWHTGVWQQPGAFY